VKPVYLALLHHPVRDRAGEIITTAVTNLDVHDIARSARAYDLAGYFLVTPIEAQAQLIERILEHWRSGAGARRVPERAEALRLCRTAPSLGVVVRQVEREAGEAPKVLVTSARAVSEASPLEPAQARALFDRAPAILVFGTGHGLAPEVLAGADGALAPIRRHASYNHLSVRAAVAITLDRLFGDGVGDGVVAGRV
jgi:tRNA (guanine37-N1)-methyltransferase